MFRAGGTDGMSVAIPARAARFSGNVVLLSDISEFQPDVADATYLRWSKAIVTRAMYGTRTDAAWYGGQRRADLHAGGARFYGIYQYVRSDEDAGAQARALADLLGGMRPGERIIGDIEEGSGSQQARWVEWADTINSELKFPPWDYSGLSFAQSHGLQPVDWVASYGAAEPGPVHKLWQFSATYPVPGVGTADCSVFHGTIDQLAALGYQAPKPAPKPSPTPVTPPAKENDMPAGEIRDYAIRHTINWPTGTVSKIILQADWEGALAAAPQVEIHIMHESSTFDAGTHTLNGGAESTTYTITSPSDVSGCSVEVLLGEKPTTVPPLPVTVAYRTQ
jgi:hypothetical protein